MTINKGKYSSFTLTLLVAIFVLPIVIAWFMYEHPNSVEEKKLNFGELITPPFSISLLKLYNDKGSLLKYKTIANGKWTLLLLNPGPCDKDCEKKLFFLRQIQRASGKNRDRVQRIVLSYLGAQSRQLTETIQRHYKKTEILLTDKNQFEKIIKHHINHAYATEPGTVYIIDPFGNVIISYKRNNDPMNIYKDLKRLLRLSQIG